ncbi:retropepsin-like aspartic protease family protein [Aquabacterium sp.]|uniref:retropepsin-like aspartic protease family protein n=1 Tax=Aquabacterium sp. TaxID=1872578 RepID=UPI002C633B9A|nr:retropepsin-like aspartic protease [Aquabacterium sp.]HSW09044.1 retropepsin-like aspartic protease [Aquabacterium sp.]
MHAHRLGWPLLTLTLTLTLTLAGGAGAQTVSLSGSLGSSKALLLIDGQPHTLAVGSSVKGVTLKRVGDGEAEVEMAGRSNVLRLGAAPAKVGGGSGGGGGNEIVLPAGPGGHFMATGSINGKSVQFMVDTGATVMAISQTDADRIGIDWKRGRRGVSHTAGGVVPVYGVNLTSVRIGDVEVFNVEAVVLQADMPMVLLGNSFLSRFSMRRDSDVMRLERK